jgi:hypothetical protein
MGTTKGPEAEPPVFLITMVIKCLFQISITQKHQRFVDRDEIGYALDIDCHLIVSQ